GGPNRGGIRVLVSVGVAEVRQDVVSPAPLLLAATGARGAGRGGRRRVASAGRQLVFRGVIGLERETDLLQVMDATRAGGGRPKLLHGREQNSRENHGDGN